jgi:hypothetical protein
MSAYFIVRAQVVDAAVKNDFDRWYREEHLSEALQAFKAKSAYRGWSQIDTSVHYAFYEFADVASANAILGSGELKRLAADFTRLWGDKVLRTRDVVEAIQSIGH